jgi:(2Fe-2S) ferredoxin
MDSKLDQKIKTLQLHHTQRHIFLCVNDGGVQKCCTPEAAAQSWAYLKSRTAQLGILTEQGGGVCRTKAGCLRLCAEGPVAVVYPDATWYKNCTPEVLEKIITQHLVGGTIVAEHTL